MKSPFVIPPGFALSLIPRADWQKFPMYTDETLRESLMDKLLIWEEPQPKQYGEPQQYVVSVDVGGGVGKDRTVADVTRVGTLSLPDEQVAQYISDTVDPLDFAHHLDIIGRFYADVEGEEAMMAIENNLGPGMVTQAELQRHFGYNNFFVWRYFDSKDPRGGYSTKIGWATTPKTRPWITSNYIKAVNSLDANGNPDYRINSPFTIEELQDFQTHSHPWEAEAAEGAHDDCIIAGAIGLWVAKGFHYEDREPIADQRRRKAEEDSRKDAQAARLAVSRDYINSDVTADEMNDRDEFYQEQERID